MYTPFQLLIIYGAVISSIAYTFSQWNISDCYPIDGNSVSFLLIVLLAPSPNRISPLHRNERLKGHRLA